MINATAAADARNVVGHKGEAAGSVADTSVAQAGQTGNVPVATETLTEIYWDLTAALKDYKENELGPRAGLLAALTEFYKRLALIVKSTDWIKSTMTPQGPTFSIASDLKNKLLELKEALRPTKLHNREIRPRLPDDKLVVAHFQGPDFRKGEEICRRLGIVSDPEKNLMQGGREFKSTWPDGSLRETWIEPYRAVTLDTTPIDKLLAMIQSVEGKQLTIAEYNAWKAGFDIEVSFVEDAVKMNSQKYTNAYSHFEQFYKTVSSVIEALARSLRGFLQF